MGGAEEDGAETVRPMEIGTDLIQVAKNLAVDGRLTAVHHANYVPFAAAEFQLLSQMSSRIPLRNGFPNDDFSLAGSKPAAVLQLEIVAHLDSHGQQAAQRHVHTSRAIHAG